MPWHKIRGVVLLTWSWPLFAATPLTFEDAMRQAMARVEREDTRLAAARASLQYLEAQSRFHWELRPALGLFAFTNPALLATSTGLSLFGNKGQAPSAWSIQNARLDLLDAEIANEHAKVRARMEVGRRFIDLLEKQNAVDRFAESASKRNVGPETAEADFRAGRVTVLLNARTEGAALDLEIQKADAATARDLAVLSLGGLLELDLAAGPGAFRVADLEINTGAITIPSTEILLQKGMRNRVGLDQMREQIATLEHQRYDSRVKLELPTLGYSRVSDGAGSALGFGSSQYLLGGNTGSSNFSFTIRLFDRGEGKAFAALTEARVAGLRLGLDSIESSIRTEIGTLRALAMGSVEKARLAERRAAIAKEAWSAIEMREHEGLETPEAAISAESEALRTESNFRAVENERDARIFHLFVACGLGTADLASETALAAQR